MQSCSRQPRRGATIIEMALVGPVALMLLIGILDMGLAVWSYNAAAEAAREAGRQAVVHGSKSSQPYGPAANDANVDQVARQYVFAMDQKNVQVQSSWPSGNNNPGSLVTIEVDYAYAPVGLFNLGTIKMHSTTTMTICH